MGLGRLVPRSFIRGKLLDVPVLMLTSWVHPGEVRSTGTPARDGCPKPRFGNVHATLRLLRHHACRSNAAFWGGGLRTPRKIKSDVRSTGVEGSRLRSPRVASTFPERGDGHTSASPVDLICNFLCWRLGGPAAFGRRLCRGLPHQRRQLRRRLPHWGAPRISTLKSLETLEVQL